MNRDSLRILVSAAEASSDAHGAELLKALGRLSDRRIEAFGIGGPKLQASGFPRLSMPVSVLLGDFLK